MVNIVAIEIDLLKILHRAFECNASDVIISSNAPICFRINGVLIPTKSGDLAADDVKRLIYDILNNDEIAKFELERELDFSKTYGQVIFRGSLFYQRGSVAATFRIIPAKIPSLQELNLPPIIEDIALSPQGFVLVTGPAGHGKSTTQACMIDIINTNRQAHIITAEDPIEYLHFNKKSIIEQREIGRDSLSFANALRHALRQSPDVILVGEMRDLESISIALTAAETGHLVISTLHTNDAVQAIDRIIDVFPSHQQNQIRIQLSMSLLCVIAQRLIPRADNKGRIVAVEILRNNPAVANLIREQKTHQLYAIMETHAKEGMKTMDSALKELYMKGLISYEEAKKRMKNPALL